MKPKPDYRKLKRHESRVYKYELTHAYGLRPVGKFPVVRHPWLNLWPDGILTFTKGYQWDGASGPAIDTPDWMTASLVHDGLYQLIKEKIIGIEYRKAADQEMLSLLKDAGMGRVRRSYSYAAVRVGGALTVRKAWREKGLT